VRFIAQNKNERKNRFFVSDRRFVIQETVMSDVDPIIGNWYRNEETGRRFRGRCASTRMPRPLRSNTLKVKLEELDLDAWYELPIEAIEAPEDWSGPFDEMEADDLGYEEDDE
jgi:hypothetical protein